MTECELLLVLMALPVLWGLFTPLWVDSPSWKEEEQP